MKKEFLTFIHDYETVGSKGNTWWFKLRDQYYGEGPYSVLVPCMEGCRKTGTFIPVDMYKIFPDECSSEYYMVPDDVAIAGVEVIPDSQKSMRRWYEDKFWFLPVGDMEAMNKALFNVDIHGRLEHNGEEIYKMIQEISPDVTVKFNASCDYYNLEEAGVKEDGEIIYYLKK